MPNLIPLERLANLLACLQSSVQDPIELFSAHVYRVHLANYQATVESHRLVPITHFPPAMITKRAREIRKSGACDHHLALRTAVTMRPACMDDQQSHNYLAHGADMLLELVCHVVISSHIPNVNYSEESQDFNF